MYIFFVWTLLRPFPLICLLLGAAIANLWWKRRETRGRLILVTVAYLCLILICCPALSRLALGTLEWQFPPLLERPTDAQAIVVLASYVEPPNETWPRPELDREALYRCEEAALIYQQGRPCPVVISGGKPDPDSPGPTCAKAMRDFLVRLGVNAGDTIVEENSRTTYENALETSKLLNERGLSKIILVTKATHLPRAVGCFRKLGFEVVPCGCYYQSPEYADSRMQQIIPNPAAVRSIERVCHEWLGVVWYRLRGRI
jgi:uncharacterized SAM-binding protein YcdF (DUF218 family)